MAKINVLPKSVAELIAAGEVVERPMSVVKELIENSIDAGADNITVEIKNGGVKYIRVTDNGCGIAREDVRTAFISHATSKIKNASDLDAIFTLGFRGEALPSIAAVSRLSLLTKTEEEEVGTGYSIEGGEEISLDDAGCPTGTTFIVRDLFFNTPARMKFLRRDITEGTYVSDVVTKESLGHPSVKFTLIRDGKKTLSTPGSGDMYSAVYSVFGKEVAEALIKCDYEDERIKIHGFVSRPLNNRPNRNMQFFFVNGRAVRVPAAVPALDEAYKNSIMVGKFPMCFLALTIPTEKTDVNIHPAKTEIRFAEESKLFESVFYAAKSALAHGDTVRPEVNLPPRRDVTAKTIDNGTQLKLDTLKKATWGEPLNKAPAEKPSAAMKAVEETPASAVLHNAPEAEKPKVFAENAPAKEKVSFVLHDRSSSYVPPASKASDEKTTGYNVPWMPIKKNPDIDISADEEDITPKTEKPFKAFEVPENIQIAEKPFKASETSESATVPEKTGEVPVKAADTEEPFRIIGEAFKTYIIVERGNKLLLIDKHAAHERMIFNAITSDLPSEGSQLLLMPVSVTLSPKEYAAVMENTEVFEKAGFSVEDFGASTVLVRECPVELTQADISLIVNEMAGKLLKGSLRPVPEKLDWLYHSTACRAAVKAGDELKPEETESFVRKLLADDDIKYCPHGRPVMYELSKHEIEKQFGRLG